jgi:hypothetical protein
MAEPARGSADDPGPADAPDRRPDPRAPGWVHVQAAMIADADAVVLAAQQMIRRPEDPAAREMVALTLAALESLGEVARLCTVGEAVLAEQRQRGFDEGVAACKEARCRLEVLPGGLAAGPH